MRVCLGNSSLPKVIFSGLHLGPNIHSKQTYDGQIWIQTHLLNVAFLSPLSGLYFLLVWLRACLLHWCSSILVPIFWFWFWFSCRFLFWFCFRYACHLFNTHTVCFQIGRSISFEHDSLECQSQVTSLTNSNISSITPQFCSNELVH